MARPAVVPRGLPRSLEWAARVLGEVSDGPTIEAEVLVCHVGGISRTEAAIGRGELTVEQAARLEALVARRLRREPLQYITGTAGFYGLELEVGPGCLVPRPETETLVERTLQLVEGGARILDLGTGSGAIACALAAHRPDARIVATEISTEAARYAQKNFELCGAEVELLIGDLFGPLDTSDRGTFDVVVSNPPYLGEDELRAAPPEVASWEPEVALLAGPDGSEVASRIIIEATEWLRPGGSLLLETHPGQVATLQAAMGDYLDVSIHEDLAGRKRVIEGRLAA